MDAAYVIFSMVVLFVLAAVFDLFGTRATRREVERLHYELAAMRDEMESRFDSMEPESGPIYWDDGDDL